LIIIWQILQRILIPVKGYSQLEEFTAVLDMPCYANSSYQKIPRESHLFEASLDEIKLAGAP